MRKFYSVFTFIFILFLIKIFNNQEIDKHSTHIDNSSNDDLSYQENDNLENNEDEQMLEAATSVSIINKIKLNDFYKIICPNNNVKLRFKEMIFNSSIYNIEPIALNLTLFDDQQELIKIVEVNSNLYLNLKSDNLFRNLFGDYSYLKHIQSDIYTIDSAKYTDSGRYYCVYSMSQHNEIFISSYLYLVYDEEIIVKNFNETIELEPVKDDNTNPFNNSDITQWFYDDSSQNFDLFFSLNEINNNLVIKLKDIRLFDISYRSQNIINGAYKTYLLECSNCESLAFSPLISPVSQIATVGSEVIFTCEKPQNSKEPDRYQWFKYSNDNESLNLKNSYGSGQILKLANLSLDNTGWYLCCILNKQDKDDNTIESVLNNAKCSSVELKVNNIVDYDNNNEAKLIKNKIKTHLLLALSSICILTFILLVFLIFICHKKLENFKNTHKATNKLNKNSLYLDRNELIDESNSSSNTSLLNIEITNEINLREILISSSSIEQLLDEKEIKRWKIEAENLKMGEIIGQGAFGLVLFGKLKLKDPVCSLKERDNDSGLETTTIYTSQHNNSKNSNDNSSFYYVNVAVKKLHKNATQKNYFDLYRELKLMFQVGQHPNIINLIGYCIENKNLYIITDYAKYGNLKDFLRKNGKPHYLNEEDDQPIEKHDTNLIPLDYLLIYSYQIASGMQYLHYKNVLHRDLAARNILVDEYDSIKISDFGLARNMNSDYYYVQKLNTKLPFKWLSPESLRCNKISKESDVWSFGILLWEIYTYGCTPYPGLAPEQILDRLESGYRMEKPKECDQFIYDNIMLKCWNINPKQRPRFTQLLEQFQILLNKKDYQNTKVLIETKINKNLLSSLNKGSNEKTNSSSSVTDAIVEEKSNEFKNENLLNNTIYSTSSLNTTTTPSYSFNNKRQIINTLNANSSVSISIESSTSKSLSSLADNINYTETNTNDKEESDKEEEFLKKCLFDENDYKNLIKDIKFNYNNHNYLKKNPIIINSSSDIDISFKAIVENKN